MEKVRKRFFIRCFLFLSLGAFLVFTVVCKNNSGWKYEKAVWNDYYSVERYTFHNKKRKFIIRFTKGNSKRSIIYACDLTKNDFSRIAFLNSSNKEVAWTSGQDPNVVDPKYLFIEMAKILPRNIPKEIIEKIKNVK